MPSLLFVGGGPRLVYLWFVLGHGRWLCVAIFDGDASIPLCRGETMRGWLLGASEKRAEGSSGTRQGHVGNFSPSVYLFGQPD